MSEQYNFDKDIMIESDSEYQNQHEDKEDQGKNEYQSQSNISSYNRNNKIKTAYSWPVIILFIFAFFPIAFYLIYKRYTYEQTNLLKNSKSLRNAGITLFCIGFLLFLSSLGQLGSAGEENKISTVIFILLVFCGTGTGFFLKSLNMNKDGEKYSKYSIIILKKKVTSLDVIASTVGYTYENVEKDLLRMINLGFFSDAYIDNDKRKIVLSQFDNLDSKLINKTKVVTCKGCGASNTVVAGKICVCEYCGITIE